MLKKKSIKLDEIRKIIKEIYEKLNKLIRNKFDSDFKKYKVIYEKYKNKSFTKVRVVETKKVKTKKSKLTIKGKTKKSKLTKKKKKNLKKNTRKRKRDIGQKGGKVIKSKKSKNSTDHMKKDIDANIKYYSSLNKNGDIASKLDKYYQQNREKGIIKLIIQGNTIRLHRSRFSVGYLNLRTNIIYDMFKFYLKNMNHKFGRQFSIYIYLGDTTLDVDLPIMYFAKSSKEKGFLIPDWTFHNAYKSKFATFWDKQSKIIVNNCNRYKFSNKDNIIFFQGSNTSQGSYKNKTNIRKDLENIVEVENNYNMKILIDKPSTPITDWCKYKYLLDLPGAHPWSVRFKELMLTGSYVIKVDHVDPWVNFYSYLFKPGENYFQIKITNYKDEKLNFKENKKVYNEIVKIYEKTKNNKTLFNKMSQNNKKIY